MATFLVTGGAGFIGSHFCNHIYNNRPQDKIIILDNLTYAGNIENIRSILKDTDRVQFWQADINDVAVTHELVKKSDYVVHFAAETHVARSLYANRGFYRTDVLGTQSIAGAVLEHKDTVKRFIHVSTSEVYGTALSEPMDENHILNPATPYASAKAGADRLVYSYYCTYKIPAVIVRPFNNYGPHQHLEKAIPRFITNVLSEKPITLHGDGEARRDWLWVEDTVCGILSLIDHKSDDIHGEVFNLGTGVSVSVKEIANMVQELLGKKSQLNKTEDRFGQVQNHISSTDKIFKATGFKAKMSFVDGLQKTIAWYSQNPKWWQRQQDLAEVPIRLKNGKVIHW